MITIEGLTQRQRDILDLMWNLDTMDEVMEFISSLDDFKDQVDASSLAWMVMMDYKEEQGLLDEHAGTVQRIIDRIAGQRLR